MTTSTKDHYNSKYSTWEVNDLSLLKAKKEDTIILKSLLELCECSSKKAVLEIGSGVGYKSQILHELGNEVTSIELSEVAVEKSKMWWAKDIKFICADFLNLNLDKMFDIVYSSSFSPLKHEFKNNDSHVLSKMFSLVKPGGYFIFEWGRNSKFEESYRQWAYISRKDVIGKFAAFGNIKGIYAGHRQLSPFVKKYYFSPFLTFLTLLGSFFHNKGYRLYVVVKK